MWTSSPFGVSRLPELALSTRRKKMNDEESNNDVFPQIQPLRAVLAAPRGAREARGIMSGTLRVGGGGRRGAGAPRFSLLHMDDGEDYVLDVAGSMTAPPPAAPADEAVARTWWCGKTRGRVRLLTKSLVFEPADASAPMAKFAFAGVTRLEAVGTRRDAFELVCSKPALLRTSADASAADPRAAAADALAPWRFELPNEAFAKLFEPASGLLKVARQTPSVAEATLAATQSRREDRARFDTSALADERERIAFDAPAARITPFVREPGRLVITDARVYFQPLAEVSPVTSPRREKETTAPKRRVDVFDARGVVAAARRTHAARPLAVEFFFLVSAEDAGEDDRPPSALFTLRTEAEREACVAAALAPAAATVERAKDATATATETATETETRDESVLTRLGSALAEGEPRALRAVTDLWRSGDLSTLDYLLYLNVASGRSHSDLAQWPVMPWVLRDYRSERLDLDDVSRFRDLRRPVGALEPGRLRAFRERAAQMHEATGETKYLYGTHYSAPGYVLYWLLRSDPEHHLRLQNGAFDAPDRLFHGVSESFDGVLRSTADVKELVPEFFCGSGDFLVNRRGLRLGTRQVDGEVLNDVRLPPWARGSPELFILKHREALESEPVSRSIHAWIDLIFGYSQTGPNAEKADNTFHPLTYQGALRELDATKDPVQRRAKEAQIQEFVRAPRRLFAQPHPPRDAALARGKWMTRRAGKPESESFESSARDAASRARDVLATLAATLEASSFLKAARTRETEKSVARAERAIEEAETEQTRGTRGTRGTRDDVAFEAFDSPTALGRPTAVVSPAWSRRARGARVAGLGFSNDGESVLGACGGESPRVTSFAARDGSLEFASVAPATAHDVGHVTCTSFALMSARPRAGAGQPAPPRDPAGDLVGFPAALVGCGDGGVYAYSAEYGRVLGRMDAFARDEADFDVAGVCRQAVSAMAVPSMRDDALFAVSRGGCVRRWDVAAGRRVGALGDIKGVSGAFRSTAGLASGAAAVIGGRAVRAYTSPTRGVLPAARRAGPAAHEAELVVEGFFFDERRTQPRAVSEAALDCDARGELVLVGGAGGEVTAWDPRCARAAWVSEAFQTTHGSPDARARGASRRVRGVALSPSGRLATAACADGFARALDLRVCGDSRDARFVGIGGLTCAAAAACGDTVFVGGEDGRVAAVDWYAAIPDAATTTFAVAESADDGVGVLSERGARRAVSGVSCLSVARDGGALAAGWEDGTVAVFART